jgi:mRNA interferase RelE/StbE
LAWTIRFDPRAQQDLAQLDGSIRRRIIRYLESRVAPLQDAEDLGKALTGSLSGMWRYRVQDHRIVCRILRDEVIVLVVAVGHRKNIYERSL